MEVLTEKQIRCYHCDDVCFSEHIVYNDKNFCCSGCRAVYELFLDTGLQDIYKDASRLKPEENTRYDYLDNDEIAHNLLGFRSSDHNTILVTLPAIHCSSCVYLLENLRLFNKGIISVGVNFVKQEADIHYDPQRISLKEVAELLHRVGYVPQFKTEKENKKKDNLPIKIGVAAFCFGNIMLLSFPEYFGFEETIDASFKVFFSYLNILLAIPVLLYAGADYFVSAFKGLKNKFINIDVPIALGIITLFVRSVYEVVGQTGSGYLDSLAGLVFFLLLGRWFQNKTYENLSFERDYKSYFPLAVSRVENDTSSSVPIGQLCEGDEVIIHNQEIIPADAILLSHEANIDYSFVTGEERTTRLKTNDQLFAGGRQMGPVIHIRITKPSSQSYLTSLWNNQVFKSEKNADTEFITNKISKYFTAVILLIAMVAGLYWYLHDTQHTWQVITAVLIVACPCALALSAPFTNGNLLRIFGNHKFYLKNALSVEKLNAIDTVVFDKTGTLTLSSNGKVSFVDEVPLRSDEMRMIKTLVSNSMHPLSQKIAKSLEGSGKFEIVDFEEIPGKGLKGYIQGVSIALGSAAFVSEAIEEVAGRVYVRIGDRVRGYFEVSNQYRSGLSALFKQLGKYRLVVLSGDNDHEREVLQQMFPSDTEMLFKQQPQDKLDFIKALQKKGHKVLMLGDGLNDAGALKQSDVGIAVTEDMATFSPACDGILSGSQLQYLAKYLSFAKIGRSIVIASFTISFMYNFVGLSFAVSGALTPIFAAVLMPLSSISVVLFTTLSGNYFAHKKQLI